VHATWERDLGTAEGEAYDAFVARSPSGHACQTRAWAPVARAGTFRSTRFVAVRDGSDLVGVALVTRPRVAGVPFPWASVDRGPVVDDPSMLAPCLRAVERTARAHGVLRLRVMPYWSEGDAQAAEDTLARCGYRDVQELGGAHARTLRVDLRGEESLLFAGAALGEIRRRSARAAKAGATARRGTHADWPRLRAMHSTLMRSQHLRGHGRAWWDALETFVSDDARGSFFVCELEGRVVSASIVLRHAGQATYAWGASVPDSLAFAKAVPSLVAAIRWAHSSGCTTFDLGGIPLEGDRDPKREAIAVLKRDFSRKPVRLVREHARWLVP
jgi:lipid II:glycine glycyltransferase (peptidoglycan interpeptide bridge formation enzyme)